MEPTINFYIQSNSTQFKVPTELIKKNFKTAQKLIEKQKKQLTNDVSKIQKNPSLPTPIKLEMIRKLIKSFETFQKKLQLVIDKDKEYRERLVARLDNLNQLSQFTVNDESQDDDDKILDHHNSNLINWYRDQANVLIIDYLIKSNVKTEQSIGMKLLHNLSTINPKFMKLIDYDLFENFNKIYVSIIENHDLSLVISWFEDNRNSLKKINLNLEFEINYCKFLSFIQDGKTDEAIKFSQNHLSKNGNISNYSSNEINNYYKNLEKLKGIGGLLVFLALNETENDLFSSSLVKNSSRFHSYEKLLSDDRWTNLSEVFIENFTKLYGISKNYPLFIYLSAGLSSLKTKSCYCNYENTIFFNENQENIGVTHTLLDKKLRGPNHYYKLLNKINHCPVCSPEMFKLSRNLPYAQLITNIFNNPYKLPNGNIYPFDKLTHPTDKYLSQKDTLLRDVKIRDPLTREIFSIEDCIRVYPA